MNDNQPDLHSLRIFSIACAAMNITLSAQWVALIFSIACAAMNQT